VSGLIGETAKITLVDPDDAAGTVESLAVVRYQLQSGSDRKPRLRPAPPLPAVSLIAGAPLLHLLADSGLPRDAARGYPVGWREKDMADLLGAPFVWFRDGGAEASELAGLKLETGASYLVAHADGKAAIVKSWPFPPAK